MLDGKDFLLEGDDGHYAREISEHWCFGDRAFGGYTSALALRAMFDHSERSVAASMNVTFLEGGAAGPIEIDVSTLRSGRTATAEHATVEQDGRPILLATAWLADGWADEPEARVPAIGELPTPEASPPLNWLGDEWPPLRFAERRGVDYPTAWAEFARGRPEIALWVRVDSDLEEPLPHAQLGDILHADAHLFDAPGQVTGFETAAMLSLDLTIAWQPGSAHVPSTAWRLMESKGSLAPGGVTSVGALRAQDGSLLASALSQGLLRR